MIALPNVGGVLKVGKVFWQARRPEILLGTSIVAQLSAMALSAKAGWDSRGQVIIAEVDKGDALTTKEIAALTWPNYIKPATAGVVAVGSTAGLHLVHVKDKKALVQTGLAALEEVKQSAKDYQEDVEASLEENLTAKQKEKVEGTLEEKRKDRGGNVHIDDYYLVTDGRTGRPIWANKLQIEDACIHVNQILNNDPCSLNTFYSFAGFDNLPDGDDLGWNENADILELKWHETITNDGRPTRVFTFRPAPKEGFDATRRL